MQIYHVLIFKKFHEKTLYLQLKLFRLTLFRGSFKRKLGEKMNPSEKSATLKQTLHKNQQP